MKLIMTVLGIISLVLSVPAFVVGFRKKRASLIINGMISLFLGAYLAIMGLKT